MVSFLRLPLELRQMVYTHFLDANPIILNARNMTPDEGLHSLLLTCKTIKAEVKRGLYQKASFCVVKSKQHELSYHEPADLRRPWHQIARLTLALHWTALVISVSIGLLHQLIWNMDSLKTLSIEFWFANGNTSETTRRMLDSLINPIRTDFMKIAVLGMRLRHYLWLALEHSMVMVPRGCRVIIKHTDDDGCFAPGTLERTQRDSKPDHKNRSMCTSNYLAKEIWEDFKPVATALWKNSRTVI